MNSAFRTLGPVLRVLMRGLFPWKVIGEENIPEGGVLICGNHTSMLDPVYLIAITVKKFQLHIVAKEELFRVPVLRWFLKKGEIIGVKRGMFDINAVKECLRVLRNGNKLLLFPEGTRVKEGETVEAHTGAAVIAIRAGVPLMPVYIERKKRLFRKTRIVFGEPYYPNCVGKKPTPEESRAITDDLMDRIRVLGEID